MVLQCILEATVEVCVVGFRDLEFLFFGVRVQGLRFQGLRVSRLVEGCSRLWGHAAVGSRKMSSKAIPNLDMPQGSKFQGLGLWVWVSGLGLGQLHVEYLGLMV